MFTLGAGVDVLRRRRPHRQPAAIVDPKVSYIVLACSAVFEGATWLSLYGNSAKLRATSAIIEAVRRSKDPPTFIVLFEDSAALLGLIIAFIGTLAAEWFAMPVLDGVASIGISLVLAVTALASAGNQGPPDRRAGKPPHQRRHYGALRASCHGIERAHVVFTVHLAPDQIVVALSLEFSDSLTTPDIEEKVTALERGIRQAFPDVIAIFVKPQTLGTYQSARLRRREPAV